jgi:hypothetical protein
MHKFNEQSLRGINFFDGLQQRLLLLPMLIYLNI